MYTYISGHFLDFTNHYSDECVPLDGSILPKVKMTQNRAKFAAVNIDGKQFFSNSSCLNGTSYNNNHISNY